MLAPAAINGLVTTRPANFRAFEMSVEVIFRILDRPLSQWVDSGRVIFGWFVVTHGWLQFIMRIHGKPH